MALKTIVSKGKKILKGLKGDKRTKVGRTIESAKTKVKEMASKTSPSAKGGKTKAATSKPPVKIPAAPKPPKPTAGPQPVKPMTKGEKIATGAAAAGAAGLTGSVMFKKDTKKPEVKKPEPKKFSPKKEETKTYQDAKLNKSNAPMPDFTPKKVDAADKAEAPKKEEFDRMQAARDQMKRARESMGMGSRFGYKKGGSVKRNMRDGCAVRGKTKGKLY
jgi:hypothetical protein